MTPWWVISHTSWWDKPSRHRLDGEYYEVFHDGFSYRNSQPEWEDMFSVCLWNKSGQAFSNFWICKQFLRISKRKRANPFYALIDRLYSFRRKGIGSITSLVIREDSVSRHISHSHWQIRYISNSVQTTPNGAESEEVYSVAALTDVRQSLSANILLTPSCYSSFLNTSYILKLECYIPVKSRLSGLALQEVFNEKPTGAMILITTFCTGPTENNL